jgi:hypothetical protein
MILQFYVKKKQHIFAIKNPKITNKAQQSAQQLQWIEVATEPSCRKRRRSYIITLHKQVFLSFSPVSRSRMPS